jgi:hypothetical protein
MKGLFLKCGMMNSMKNKYRFFKRIFNLEKITNTIRVILQVILSQPPQNDIVTGNDCVKKYLENPLTEGSSV